MARRNKWMHLLAGLAVGVIFGIFLKLSMKTTSRTLDSCPGTAKVFKPPNPLEVINLRRDEIISNSNRTLVFVGVMTAEQYLDTRAKAVYETWGKELPGRIAFFSSEVSRADYLPLIPLRGVDDSYPPQKKSFLMLLYMYEHYGDRFEWFLRADDDVYVRGDKLEQFLRSVDSRKPQFIGQAGRGTNAERDALSLDYNENFCMGGPGVLLSKETLRRVAPHVKYCLQHLLTAHEDVELGRCVAKFAGVSCTWSYDMQTILHHNGSGTLAYTGRLKRREVHRAITLHPIKDHRHMYRIHTYFKNYRIQELRDESVEVHREISSCMKELSVPQDQVDGFLLPGDVPLFPAKIGDAEYLGNNSLLGAPVSMSRFKEERPEDILQFDFVSKSIYSSNHQNPKRRIEVPYKEALDDVIREAMEIINAPSRQRGRVIDFNELLYGYTRLDPLHGADHILDLLLKYRRYRGRKMTAAVRRHAYLQQTFTGMEIRELPLGEPAPLEEDHIISKIDPAGKTYSSDYADFDDTNQHQNSLIDFNKLNNVFESSLNKIHSNLPSVLKWNDDVTKEYSVKDRRIHFLLPLSGRYEIFTRFMKNYEDVVLSSDEVVTLIVVLYKDQKSPVDYKKTEGLMQELRNKYYSKDLKLIKMGSVPFSRGAALTEGLNKCDDNDLVFFIDVDIMFNYESLRRIRINTVKFNQVYFPIVFSEYNPDVVNGEEFNKYKFENKQIDKTLGRYDLSSEIFIGKSEHEITNYKYTKRISADYGYFRQYGFGILGIYKRDFDRLGGFDLNIKGWGLEDVELFEKIIKSNLTVFRLADDSLIHIFHSVDCDKSLVKSQYIMCIGTKASTYGSQKHMAYYMLNYPEILWPAKQEGTR